MTEPKQGKSLDAIVAALIAGQVARDAERDRRYDEEKQAVNERLENIENSMKEMMAAFNIAKGGIRLLIAVGTIAAGLGAMFDHIIKYIKGM